MEQLHTLGGIPSGWRFTLPVGDPAEGRRVFIELECFKCHAVKGESFSAAPAKQAVEVGPDLTGMGGHHPAEYFAESILDPNRILVEGSRVPLPGWELQDAGVPGLHDVA
jgi:cbb3-type cytochrome oxidase cytochrome c subunit